MNDEEEGKGSKEEDETHNDLDGNNEPKQGENDEGLDAANRMCGFLANRQFSSNQTDYFLTSLQKPKRRRNKKRKTLIK